MMRRKFNKVLSLLLAGLMLATSMPMNTCAAEAPESPIVTPEGEPVSSEELLENEEVTEEEAGEEETGEEEPTEKDSSDKGLNEEELSNEKIKDDALDNKNEKNRDEVIEEITVTISDSELPTMPIEQDYSSDELLMAYFNREVYGETEGVFYGADRGATLFEEGTVKRIMYDAFKERAIQIANGEDVTAKVSFTIEEVLGKSVFTANEVAAAVDGGKITTSNYSSYFDKWSDSIFSIDDVGEVFSAVKNDCPYEFYWAGLRYGGGVSGGYSISRDASGNVLSFNVPNINIVMYSDVAEDFAKGYISGKVNLNPDTAKTSAAKSAAANAKSIVAGSDSYDTDYAKMKYYLDQICSLTDYNNDAANGSYGKTYIYVI